jgi:hypothetical protein
MTPNRPDQRPPTNKLYRAGERLERAGNAMSKAGSEMFWAGLALLFSIFVGIPWLLHLLGL